MTAARNKAAQAEDPKAAQAAALVPEAEPETKGTATKAKDKTPKTHAILEGETRSLCGIWHQDPRLTEYTDNEDPTCLVCQARMRALAEGKTPKARAKVETTTITCGKCGAERELYPHQIGTVTLCIACTKKARRLRHAKARAERKAPEKAAISRRGIELAEGVFTSLDLDGTMFADDIPAKARLVALYKVRKALDDAILRTREELGLTKQTEEAETEE